MAGCGVPVAQPGCGVSQLPTRQIEMLQSLTKKHLQDPALTDIADSDDFHVTSFERGVQRWEHSHLVAALDLLNAYQRDRRARLPYKLAGFRPSMRRRFAEDPRTRFCEMLKRWLRVHAANAQIPEDEIRSIAALCRELLNHRQIFPSRNPRSFMRTNAEVYDHLQWQLREVLERDRTCAELTQRALSLSRNLIADVVAYLLLAPTDLRQTDNLPSLEVVSLWQSLPDDGHPLPGRADPAMQKSMREAWSTRCGAAVAAVVSTPWCIRLFDGCSARDESMVALATELDTAAIGDGVSARIREARIDFESGQFKNSGLAGIFRSPLQREARERYLTAIELVFDLTYLLGVVMVQFNRVSDGLGDYGTVRVSTWLHKFLDVLTDKVQKLKASLEHLNREVESTYVLQRARGVSVPKPAPSDRMCARAHGCLERAISGRQNHAGALAQVLDELRARSSPERLPHILSDIRDACAALRDTLTSNEFTARAGVAGFPQLPALGDAQATQMAALTNGTPSSQESGALVAREKAPPTPPRGGAANLQHEVQQQTQSSAAMHAVVPEWQSVSVTTVGQGNPSAIQKETVAEFDDSGGMQCESVHDVVTESVHRLTQPILAVAGSLARHDTRTLQLVGKHFRIFQPGSGAAVKISVAAADVEICKVLPGAALSLTIATSSRNGVAHRKGYIFEFASNPAAVAFSQQLIARGATLLPA